MITPISVCCQNALMFMRLRPLRSRPMTSTPANTPSTEPRPPKKLAPPSGHQQRGEARKEPRRGVDEYQHAVDVDAAHPRRLGIAADREDVPAQRNLLQKQADTGIADEQHDGAHGDDGEFAAEGQRDVGDAEKPHLIRDA